MIYDFDASALAPLNHDACVIVETDRGEALGWTVGEPEDREPHTDGVLRRILRVAGPGDETRRQELQRRETEALRFCARAAAKRNLPMKVIAVEWAHSGEKAAFYFSSEDRIDFRELVRELAQHFRIRVEMRQVGPRDEAKIIGAMGPCGRETCCSSWMRAFTPVSIKMAKDQGLSITPAKVTGVCGRLLCCLAYEQDTYKELRRKLPKLGKQVVTPRGNGRIIDVLALRESVRVFLEEGGVAEFLASEVRPVGSAAPVAEEAESDSDATDALDEVPAPTAVAPSQKPLPAPPPRLGRERQQHRPPPQQGRPTPQERPAPQERPPAPEARREQQRPHGHPERREGRPQQQPRSREDRPQQHGPRPQQQGQRPERPGQRPHQPGPRPERPNRPPRPESPATPTSPAPAPTDVAPGESGGEGARRRHRHRRRGGGGQGGPSTPEGGGTPPPASS